jgi:hypothetical protein
LAKDREQRLVDLAAAISFEIGTQKPSWWIWRTSGD